MFFFCLACLMLGMTIGCKDKKPEFVEPDSLDTVQKADTLDTLDGQSYLSYTDAEDRR